MVGKFAIFEHINTALTKSVYEENKAVMVIASRNDDPVDGLSIKVIKFCDFKKYQDYIMKLDDNSDYFRNIVEFRIGFDRKIQINKILDRY